MPSPPASRDSSSLVPVALHEALEERYLAYALSTIMGRALPDVRDGLKPVHRRILYGMDILRLNPGTAFKKCAKIVGDVMGSFHPHGDQAIYEALARLAQDFVSRYPLIEGQGNFGNIDGDAPAAYRYTEARMTEVARLLLEGLEENAVDFRDNYSGDQKEPLVLPAAFPNLLANGAQGIAVGMATSIPSHNVAELCEAALALIRKPQAAHEDLMALVPGPDFSTGGVLIDPPSHLREVYRTGRGTLRLRAQWTVEQGARGAWICVITAIPYMVQKGRLIEQLAHLLTEKQIPLVNDIRDESAEDVRIVIEPRSRTLDPVVLMESLFRLSDLESRISVNMNVLVDGVIPRVVSLTEALQMWLNHCRDVLIRRTHFRLQRIAQRLELLDGLLIVFLNLDKIIKIIRNDDDPKEKLKKTFKLSDAQAHSILETRLRSLRKLEEQHLRQEQADLLEEEKDLKTLVSQEEKQWKKIAADLRLLKKTFGPDTKLGKRRTEFASPPDIDPSRLLEALSEREPLTLILTQKGWIRALKGHVSDFSNLSFKGDDSLQRALPTFTTDKILFVTSDGKVFTLEASKLPSGRGMGEPLRLLMDITEGEDVITLLSYEAGKKLILASADGRGFIASHDHLLSATRKGRQVFNGEESNKITHAIPLQGDHLAVIGENRKLLIFPALQLPEMARGKGVRLQRYKDGQMKDIKSFTLKEGLHWKDAQGRETHLTAKDLTEWIGNRADPGRLAPRGFPKTNLFGG